MTKHKRHTNEKPYICDFDGCDAAFAQSGHLTKHKFYWHTKEGQVRKKKDEARILRLLNTHGFDFKPQHFIDFVCLGPDRDGDRCFVDFLIEIQDTNKKVVGFIFLEVDEHQHKLTNYSISCENRRMTDAQRSLSLEGNSFPIVFIRYNPHEFTVNNQKQKVRMKDREAKLVKLLQTIELKQPFSVMYMFYDTVDGNPYIFTDPTYEDSFKQLVTQCVV